MRGIEGHVVGDEQIEVAVAIVIEEAAARAPAVLDAGHARLLGDVRECAVAVVAVEHVSPEVGDEEIVEPIVVVVADATRLTPSGAGQAGFAGHVREGAIAIVVEQITGGLPAPAAGPDKAPFTRKISGQPSLS